MGITSSGLYFENSLLNSKKGYIESSSAMIEDENVTFTGNFLVETVSDRSSRRLEWSFPNGSSILCGLPLRVVEISRDGDDSVVNGRS